MFSLVVLGPLNAKSTGKFSEDKKKEAAEGGTRIVTIFKSPSNTNTKTDYSFDLKNLADITQEKGILLLKTYNGLLGLEIVNENGDILFSQKFNEYGYLEALINLSEQPVGKYEIRYETPIRELKEIVVVN